MEPKTLETTLTKETIGNVSVDEFLKQAPQNRHMRTFKKILEEKNMIREKTVEDVLNMYPNEFIGGKDRLNKTGYEKVIRAFYNLGLAEDVRDYNFCWITTTTFSTNFFSSFLDKLIGFVDDENDN